jgi:hypothetical protein
MGCQVESVAAIRLIFYAARGKIDYQADFIPVTQNLTRGN